MKPNKVGSAAYGNKSHIHETLSRSKRKRFIQVLGPGKMVDSLLKDHLTFLLKSPVLKGMGRGGISLFNHPANFWHTQALPSFFLFLKICFDFLIYIFLKIA